MKKDMGGKYLPDLNIFDNIAYFQYLARSLQVSLPGELVEKKKCPRRRLFMGQYGADY